MKKDEKKDESQLGEFSQSLIKVGKEIEGKLEEKERLESEIRKREVDVRKLQIEIFESQTKLAKLSSELAGLEEQRQKLEVQKPGFNILMRKSTGKKQNI